MSTVVEHDVVGGEPAGPLGGIEPGGPLPADGENKSGRPAQGRVHQMARAILRGRREDPSWVRPCLLLLLGATAVLYLVDLGASGWANSFYSAAVQAGTKSWKAFFFGSSDSSNFITVDKPPASLWVMEISARIFGVNSWSILAPQALEGVASVGMLYLTVRRWFSARAALLAGALLALTPVATLMFRFNNPDALLVLLLIGAAYATIRAIDSGRTRWLALAGVLVGFGFITKMMQALVIVPVLGLVYLVAARPPLRRRLGQLLVAGLAVLVSGGWWVAAVELIPAADRPYIGGSTDNNLLNLIFGYNGFGRLTGNETGSVGGGGGAGGQWGPTGLFRLFNTDMGGQISWLIPGALILLVVALWLTRRAPRTDRTRAALILFGGWLVLTGLLFSFAAGIIHPYYTVALAPAIGAIVAIGASLLWRRRSEWLPRCGLAAALAATSAWAFVLLDRSPTWFPALRVVVLIGGLVCAAALLLTGQRRTRVVAGLGLAGLAVAGAAPAAYSLQTASTAHSGSIPSAGPATVGGNGFGGPGGGGGPGGAGAGGLGGARVGGGGFAGPGGAAGGTGAAPGGRPPAGTGFAGGFPGSPRGLGRLGLAGGGTFTGGAGSSVGGLLNGSTPSAALTKVLSADASRYTWIAAAVGSNSASGYQLATGDPVMAVGGFNGTDPAPTLSQFEAYVREGKIHYFIGGGGALGVGGALGGRGAGGSGNGTSDSSAITTWVEAHFTAKTVGGTTIYDLTKGT